MALANLLDLILSTALDILIPICELIGVFVVAVSVISSFIKYIRRVFFHADVDVKFQLASGLAVALEFKMAAEILKTVQVRDLTELLVLGAVIVLRALLSVLIHFEMKQTEKTETPEPVPSSEGHEAP